MESQAGDLSDACLAANKPQGAYVANILKPRRIKGYHGYPCVAIRGNMTMAACASCCPSGSSEWLYADYSWINNSIHRDHQLYWQRDKIPPLSIIPGGMIAAEADMPCISRWYRLPPLQSPSYLTNGCNGASDSLHILLGAFRGGGVDFKSPDPAHCRSECLRKECRKCPRGRLFLLKAT